MKHGAITFAFLLVAGAAGGLAFTGCGSDENKSTPTPEVDSGTDTGAPDTKPVDTGIKDTAPITCAIPLATGFACEDATAVAGKTVCTDAMINMVIDGCFGTTGSSTKCNDAKAKATACFNCILTDWYREVGGLDSAACVKAIDPTSTCSKTIKCNLDCLSEVCGECDPTEGTGKAGGTTSEQDDCWKDAQAKGGTTKPKGACYDVATKDYAACAGNAAFAPCFPRDAFDVKVFARGACRDNGKWDKAGEELPGADAGTDTGTSTDTGADDTGSTTTDASGD